jgi:bifunctional non-homologous end joining protein LigD
MTRWVDALPAQSRGRLRPIPPLDGPPMLATLTDRRDFDEDWLFERKLDGVRVLGVKDERGTHLLSRGGLRLDRTYPELRDALADQHAGDLTVDGEVVALRGGRTDFGLLQRRSGLTDPAAARASGVAVYFYLFDVLRLDGLDTRALPQRTRKAVLRGALAFEDPLRFTAHRNGAPGAAEPLLAEACGRGWEGLIAKRATAPYTGRRSTDWLKLKCGLSQEFVVGGFTEPAGRGVGFGALLLGYHEDGLLRYAGKVGTGWSTTSRRELRARLDELTTPRPPFHGAVRERLAHWVEPVVVAQIGFTEWTRDGMLRHPRFLGLRDDKAAGDVIRERPA